MKRAALVLLLQAVAIATAHAEEPVRASALDYTLVESRDRPIVCKTGDIERFPGQSLAQVFGAKWPQQPQPAAGSERIRAQLARFYRNQSTLKGLPTQRGLVVAAVLVDASGKPLQAEAICATTDGYDVAAKRLAMRAEYRPAVVNGRKVTSVAIIVVPYGGGAS